MISKHVPVQDEGQASGTQGASHHRRLCRQPRRQGNRRVYETGHLYWHLRRRPRRSGLAQSVLLFLPLLRESQRSRRARARSRGQTESKRASFIARRRKGLLETRGVSASRPRLSPVEWAVISTQPSLKACSWPSLAVRTCVTRAPTGWANRRDFRVTFRSLKRCDSGLCRA